MKMFAITPVGVVSKTKHINWDNTVVTGILGIKIYKCDLTHINDDHFEINLVACFLNQIYVVPVPPSRDDHDDLHANVINELTPITSAGATASAPPFLFTT